MRIKLLYICIFLLILRASHAASLPEALPDWKSKTQDTVEFKTVSDDFGQWNNRVYTRVSQPGAVEAVLMEGSGPGTLMVPSGDIKTNDYPIGFGATYTTIKVDGHEAILEGESITGLALAVKLGEKRTLTLESKSLSQDELIEFAKKVINSISD